MAGNRETAILAVAGEVSDLLQPLGSADLVQNFIRSRDGTLAPVRGPAPLIPNYGSGLPSYGNPHGIVHARLMGGRRDVTLWHTGTQIRVQDAPNRSSILLVGVAGSGALYETTLLNDTASRFPTQFLVTPQGIIIMPQGGSRPLFYDGEVVAPLGYAQAPGAPTPYGPGLGTDALFGFLSSSLHSDFGHGRLGTVSNDAGNNSRLRGGYQWAVRYIDRWLNVSPWSNRSNTLTWGTDSPGSSDAEDYRVMTVLMDISPGPDHTIGRDVARSKDLEHAGTSTLFALPNAAGGNFSGAFATIPDNVTVVLPDNAPDTWLALPVTEADPMPAVRWGRLAFGRAWYNPHNDPGAIIGTFPGRWGTPQKGLRIVPDPAGGETTGAWAFGDLMLVWTRTTTYVVTPNLNGDGFRSSVLHPTAGCVGPSAMASLPDGSVVWLGDDAFYRYDGEQVTVISQSIAMTVDGLNKARTRQACAIFDPDSQEFRCWVPDGGDRENNLCLIYDTTGSGWRRRYGESLRSVCITQDHRKLILGAGYVTPSGGQATAGAWVLDRIDPTYTEPARTYTLRTGFYAPSATEKHDAKMTAFLWVREGRAVTVTLTTYRDYRAQAMVDSGAGVTPQQPEDPPKVWGTMLWGETNARWQRRQPVLVRQDVYVPSARAFQLQLTSTSPFEFIGLSLAGVAQPAHARVERSS